MSWQNPGDPRAPYQYSPDGYWYWDGTRWIAVQVGQPPLPGAASQPGGIGNASWAPNPPPMPPPAAAPSPVPQAQMSATNVAPPRVPRVPTTARRRPYLVGLAIALAALVVLGGAGSGLVIAIRNHQTAVPNSAPSAQSVFEMPFTKGIRSARFHEVEKAGGSTFDGSGVIDFTPEHGFSESLSSQYGVFERSLEVGGVTYEQITGDKWKAVDTEPTHFQDLGWDGTPLADHLVIAAQTTVAGQQAWVLKEQHSTNEWIVGEQTGDPLEAILYGHDTYTFSDWGKAPAIKAPPASAVSTGRYSGSGSGPVVAPAATVTVLAAQVDSTASNDDPAGFQNVAVKLSYQNTAASASDFDNLISLVSADGVFATSSYTTLSPGLENGTGVSPGQTITGWDGFMVPKGATSFHLLFGEQADQSQTLDYLISISVPAPR